jgi:hypothetical protein
MFGLSARSPGRFRLVFDLGSIKSANEFDMLARR